MAISKAEFVEHREHRNLSSDDSSIHDDNSVDLIREIIFGAQIQDYSSKFGKISSQFDAIEKRLKKINEQISAHEKDIDSQLVEQKQRFDAQIQKLDAKFSEQLEETVSQNQHQTKTLNEAIAVLSNRFKQDLQKATQDLSDIKVDRSLLSDLFAQFSQTINVSGSQDAAQKSSAKTKPQTSKGMVKD